MQVTEKLLLLRNILFKSFFIGLFFLILTVLLYMPCHCLVANFYHFNLGIGEPLYHLLWILFVGLIKVILIFFFLIPALAVHCTYVKEKEKLESTQKTSPN